MSIDKSRYLMELKALLSFMDADEKAETVAVYTALFNAIEPDDTEQLIEELGSPVRLVLRLEKNYRAGQLADVLENVRSITEERSVQRESEEVTPENSAEEEQIEASTDAEPIYSEEEPEIADIEEEPLQETDTELEENDEYSVNTVEEAEVTNLTDTHEREEAEVSSMPDAVSENAAVESETSVRAQASPLGDKNASKPTMSPADTIDAVDSEKRPATSRVILAIVCTPLLLIIGALGLGGAGFVAGIPGAVCVLLGICGRYFCTYSITDMTYIPDVLMVLGLGVGILGFALGFLNLAIRLLCSGVALMYELLSGCYGKLLGKEKNHD